MGQLRNELQMRFGVNRTSALPVAGDLSDNEMQVTGFGKLQLYNLEANNEAPKPIVSRC